MQVEPLVRLWTAREGATIRRVGGDGVGLLVVEKDDGDERWARLQRPWFDEKTPPAEAVGLLAGEFGRLRADGAGCLVAALPAGLFEAFERAAGVRAAHPAREAAWWLDLAAWDPDLRGGAYKTLRQAVRRAERDGVRVAPYDAGSHRAGVEASYRAWTADRDRGDVSWIAALLDAPPRGTLAAVAVGPDGDVDEFAAYWREGAYAYAVTAFARLDRSRATEFLDVTILRRLKAEGVGRVDWGVANPETPGVEAYKRKFGPIRTEEIATAWYG
jgi:hypothetical protein